MSQTHVPFLDLTRSFDCFADAVNRAMGEVAASGAYILGPHVRAFEAAVAEYLDVPHTLACASGTDALHLALAAAGIGPGDEVITTPFTFAATVESILYLGATPVLVDIDADTFNIDPERVAEAITPQTRALLPVHLFGLPADMSALMALAEKHDLVVVEDAAQSMGGRFEGRQTGSIGTAGAFSFYPSKTLGCYGDGGLVACHDPDFHARLLELRNHGFDAGGEHVRLGYNSRLDELQAAVLEIKLPHLDAAIDRRRAIAARYDEAFAGLPVALQVVPAGCHHARGYYTLCVDERDAVRKALGEAGIATALYYGRPLHRHPYYADTCRYGELPVVEHTAWRCLSLPLYPEMSDTEVDQVIDRMVSLVG